MPSKHRSTYSSRKLQLHRQYVRNWLSTHPKGRRLQLAAAAEVVCGKLSERDVWKRERSSARWKKLAEQRKAAAAELAMLETHVKSS